MILIPALGTPVRHRCVAIPDCRQAGFHRSDYLLSFFLLPVVSFSTDAKDMLMKCPEAVRDETIASHSLLTESEVQECDTETSSVQAATLLKDAMEEEL